MPVAELRAPGRALPRGARGVPRPERPARRRPPPMQRRRSPRRAARRLPARPRPGGRAGADGATPAGAWRSFWRRCICLPAFLALRLLSWASPARRRAAWRRALAAELIGYASAWVGFALASLPLVSQAGARRRAGRASSPPGTGQRGAVPRAARADRAGGARPAGDAVASAGAGGLGYALWLEWFVAREALGVERRGPAVLVVLDLVLGLFLGGLIADARRLGMRAWTAIGRGGARRALQRRACRAAGLPEDKARDGRRGAGRGRPDGPRHPRPGAADAPTSTAWQTGDMHGRGRAGGDLPAPPVVETWDGRKLPGPWLVRRGDRDGVARRAGLRHRRRRDRAAARHIGCLAAYGPPVAARGADAGADLLGPRRPPPSRPGAGRGGSSRRTRWPRPGRRRAGR